MVTFEERLQGLSGYFISMERMSGKWVICVRYGDKWVAYNSSDNRIEAIEDDTNKNVWWYCAQDGKVTIDEILSLIEETVETNMEAIKKIELFDSMKKKLYNIFNDENNTLAKLQSLSFVFTDEKATVPKSQNGDCQELILKRSKPKKTTQQRTAPQASESRQIEVVPASEVEKEPASVVTTSPDGLSQDDISELRG